MQRAKKLSPPPHPRLVDIDPVEPPAKPGTDPEGLNLRGAYKHLYICKQPPFYRALNGRWEVRRLAEPMHEGDTRFSKRDKTRWALTRVETGELVDYFVTSTIAFRVAVALDRGLEPEVEIRVRDTGE